MATKLRTRWYKVLTDLWRNRGRTLIVALAIAVGVYAVGVILDVRDILVREYEGDQAAALPAAAIVYTQPFDDELVERIAEIPGVAAVEGRISVSTQVYPTERQAVRGGAVQPRDLLLRVYGDYERIQVDALTPLSTTWPPGERQVVLERLSSDYLGVARGDKITIELDEGTRKELTVVGVAHDPQTLGPDISSRAVGYITRETMEAFGLDRRYTELHLRIAGQERSAGALDRAAIQVVVDRVEERLERSGREVLRQRIITESYASPFIDTIVLILTTFGLLILLLSGFLVVNAISALITQQVQQIGIMKLVGARRSQITAMYIVTVLVYGVLAVAIGLPLAMLTARYLMQALVEPLLNVMTDTYAVSVPLLAAQVAIGLLLPLLAGLAPVLKGTGITSRQALNHTGMQAGISRQGVLERLLAWLQKLTSVQRTLVLAVRNALRHKGRLAQTLVVLIVGTAMFISVLSVRASVDATLRGFMRFHGYDVSVGLERPYRILRLEQAVQQVPGVRAVESWSIGEAMRQRPDGSESEGIRVVAVPPDTKLMAPEMTAGRWLPETGGVVVNSDLLEDEPDVRVGQDLRLEIDGREAGWKVVGIVPTESRGETIYMAQEDFAYATRTPGQATHVQVAGKAHDAAAQRAMETRLREQLEALGFEVGSTETAQTINANNELLFTVVVAFLILMALLLAAVGGLGLTTTMGINILERVREIGVLRAIGASNASVRRVVLAEGLVIGLLSWVVGALISLPVSTFLSEQVGLALIDVPLAYRYSLVSAVVWFFVLLGVAVIASLGPARDAVRLTIREVLAYE